MNPPRPEKRTFAKVHGAESGDVPLDDGDRVYVGVGDVVAQKYRVDRLLGVGGVGFVLAARHVSLEGYFALKFLKKRFLQDRSIVERFTREAKAACRIKSEYVARVYDVGMHGGAPFLVMEHLQGRDLATLLAENGPFDVSDAAEYLVQACAALAVAHASGIVHRDIKPENLFLVDHEGLATIKLLDFGISKVSLAPESPADDWPSEGEALTGRLTCGTPYYMSPEQVRSTATVDARTDVWSLGMVLYELLSGTTAFQGDSIADICGAILEQEPLSLAELRPDLPQEIVDVVWRCLRKNPEDRYATIAELAVALLPFAPPRALAIAEGSAWIRRAAIQTVGTPALSEGRISSGSLGSLPPKSDRRGVAVPTTPRSITPRPVQRTPVTPGSIALATIGDSAPPPRNMQKIAIAAAVVVALGALGAFAAVGLSHSSKVEAPPPSAEARRAPATAPAPPAAEAPAEHADAPAAPASTPVVARPVPAAPTHPAPAVRHVAPPPARPPASAKGTASSAPAATESAAPTPSAPARPDLGY
jgi:serine/threonine-protein kinase